MGEMKQQTEDTRADVTVSAQTRRGLQQAEAGNQAAAEHLAQARATNPAAEEAAEQAASEGPEGVGLTR